VFTARYGLIAYIKQIVFRSLKVNIRSQYDGYPKITTDPHILAHFNIRSQYDGYPKITTDPHILAHFNIRSQYDGYPKLNICISELIYCY
jgi:hypothetical protein